MHLCKIGFVLKTKVHKDKDAVHSYKVSYSVIYNNVKDTGILDVTLYPHFLLTIKQVMKILIDCTRTRLPTQYHSFLLDFIRQLIITIFFLII